MILVIAKNTFLESFRSRSFIGLVAFYGVCVCLAPIVGWVSSTDDHIVTADLIFSLLSIIGVLAAIATGSSLVHTEIKQRTLYTVLSRALPRWHFVLGKYLGLSAALVCGLTAMLFMALLALFFFKADLYVGMIYAGLLVFMEVILMAAVSLCWTTLSSPLLAAAFSLSTYAVGHAVHSLPGLIHHLNGTQWYIGVGFASLVPDLGVFTYRNRAIYGIPADWGEIEAIIYGIAWISVLLVITTSVFNRKQL